MLDDETAHGLLDELGHGVAFGTAEVIHFGELLDGEGDGELGEHFVRYPRRDFSFPAFPLNDGGGGAVELTGEFFAGHFALLTKVAEGIRGQFHAQ